MVTTSKRDNWPTQNHVMFASSEIQREWLSRGVENNRTLFLQSLVDIRIAAEELQDRAVRVLMEAGATWSEIAVALGVTRQAAWNRYAPPSQ